MTAPSKAREYKKRSSKCGRCAMILSAMNMKGILYICENLLISISSKRIILKLNAKWQELKNLDIEGKTFEI